MGEKNIVPAYIIAGGKSKRFGTDKSLHDYEGKPLIQHIFDAVNPVFDNIYISANDGEKYSFLGVETVPDIVPDLGPIGGLYSVLCHAKENGADSAFVVPCDMPNLNADLIEYMLSIPMEYDLIIPVLGSYYEPLHAIYSIKCLDPLKELIDNNKRKIIELVDKVEIRPVGEGEIEFYDDPMFIFRNINYQEDA
ncbi:MAG: molybdenum cofactor guanylyltransferase [bacterium]|nr:molybdenum cofactor guanylyltransferase [bacterium]